MRLISNKIIKAAEAFAVAAVMLFSTCAVCAGAFTSFNLTAEYSFCSDTENIYSNPSGTVVNSGALSWKLYDNSESKVNRNGLYVSEGYLQLKDGNPLKTLTDFKLEIVYSSSADGKSEAGRPFLVTSARKYTLSQLMTDSTTVLGIAENGDVYYKGQKVNHTDGSKAEDILTSANSNINPGDECILTLKYVSGKLSVTLAYNSGKTSVKLLDNYQCEISGLQQFILGGDKANRLDGVTYKSLSFYSYGEYVPHTQSGLEAVVQAGETVKEFGSRDMALTYALTQMKAGVKTELVLYADLTLSKPIEIDAGKSLTVDLNGHTLNRNCHSTMTSNGYVFLVGEGASLTVKDSSPDAQNYSSAIRGGVITGGAGDDVGGCFQMKKNSRLTVTGGSVVGCVTNDHGGAIRVADSGVKIDISNAGFYSNMTLDSSDNSHGGAIYSDYSDCRVTVKNSVFEGNYSEDNGGAVYINDGKFTAFNCFFNENMSHDDGGAVYIEKDSETSFDSCTFTGNHADGQAGAVYCNSSDGTRLTGTFKNNSAGGAGGALFINGDAVCVQDAVITGNKTGEKGGGMYVDEMYDINIQGLLIVRDNKNAKNSRDDVYLDDISVAEAHIYNGGLEPGSEVWLLTGDSGHTVSDNISEYQSRYFRTDDSSMALTFKADSSKTVNQILITSAVGSGNVKFIAAVSVAVVIAAVVFILIKRKKGADRNEKKI